MQCENCGAVATTKKYPTKVGTLCIPCWNRRVTQFQDDASEEFERKWEARAVKWGRRLGIALFYLTVLAIFVGIAAVIWWFPWR